MSFVESIESIAWAYLDFYALLKSFIVTLNLLSPIQSYSIIYNPNLSNPSFMVLPNTEMLIISEFKNK